MLHEAAMQLKRFPCLPHFWYPSAEFQLYVVRTIILVAIFSRCPKVGIAIMAAIVVSTCIAVGVVTHLYNYLPTHLVLTLDIRALSDTAMHVYNKAFAHAGSLFTAIIFGSFAAKPHQLSRKAHVFWWTVAATFACTSLFGIYSWNRGRAPEHLESVVYAALHRVAWGFAVSWVMYACATGRGGPVNKILANPLLYPLGRLSFAAYLVHVVVIFVNIILGRERTTNQPFLEAQNYISLTITSYAFAAISYLCIECPIDALDSLAFGQFKGNPNSSVEAAKQNGALELKSGHSANGTAGNNGLYVGYLLFQINDDNNKIPFSSTNYDDGLHKKECKNQVNVHEEGTYERNLDAKVTNNEDSSVSTKL
ncbi:nose resistant to fluoxetine protein 6-like [Ixodes scapularis]